MHAGVQFFTLVEEGDCQHDAPAGAGDRTAHDPPFPAHAHSRSSPYGSPRGRRVPRHNHGSDD